MKLQLENNKGSLLKLKCDCFEHKISVKLLSLIQLQACKRLCMWGQKRSLRELNWIESQRKSNPYINVILFYIIEILFNWHNRQEPSVLSGKVVILAPQRRKCDSNTLLGFAMNDIYIVIIKYIIQRSLNMFVGQNSNMIIYSVLHVK